MPTAADHPALDALDTELDAVAGIVSVWFGGADGTPRFVRNENAQHYAASTMKVAVMAAAHRLADAGKLDLDERIEVHNGFASVSGSGTFTNDPGYDNDPEPWQRIGHAAPLRWLIRRMIIKSSNLSTNLLLERTGFDAVRDVWSSAQASHSATVRGIEDYAARSAGMTNIVTAADLASLLMALRDGRLASPRASAEMLEVLHAQEADEPLVNGLPAGVRSASKSGWVDGIRHSMAIVTPDDAPEFVLVTCFTSGSADDGLLADIVTRVAAAAWSDRRRREHRPGNQEIDA